MWRMPIWTTTVKYVTICFYEYLSTSNHQSIRYTTDKLGTITAAKMAKLAFLFTAAKTL